MLLWEKRLPGCILQCLKFVRFSGWKAGKVFDLLEKKDQEAKRLWDVYTDFLAVALNNIHMILDCNIILGGYVGSYAEPYMPDIWRKVLERNTFADDGQFVNSCKYGIALGAALQVIENFVKEI